ncbi:MAG: FAD-binding protein [Bacteroidetes bacterium]|nr:FAD-binding protein [Bacteroidota bacterium]
METDVLIIGSGIAGLTYAVNLAMADKHLKITMLTKTQEDETNTKYAQGGVAAVTNLNNDSFEKHIHDTPDCR